MHAMGGSNSRGNDMKLGSVMSAWWRILYRENDITNSFTPSLHRSLSYFTISSLAAFYSCAGEMITLLHLSFLLISLFLPRLPFLLYRRNNPTHFFVLSLFHYSSPVFLFFSLSPPLPPTHHEHSVTRTVSWAI